MPTNARVDQWAAKLDFAGLERQHGLPSGILTNLVYQESKGDPSAESGAGAKGLCQFMDPTAKQYGVDVTSPASSIKGAARYLEDLLDMFNGDVDKAIAAYNCGQGRVRNLVKQHGDNWREHLPKETKGYLRIVGEGVGSSAAQRVVTGNASADDLNEEETRRRGRLAEAGFSEEQINSLGGNEIVGLLFFLLIRNFVEARTTAAEAGRGFETVPSEPEKEFSPALNQRAAEVKALGATASKPLPVKEADASEPVSPQPIRLAQNSGAERTPILVG